ncbi:MAG: hypothetical protein SGI89_15050 [bacterium]|nr:hypothetical protein [bacterium]
MQIKKIILALFIIFCLQFSFQPVGIYSREKDLIVFVIESKKDNSNDEFIKRNETRKFALLVSLSMMCLCYGSGGITLNNTS